MNVKYYCVIFALLLLKVTAEAQTGSFVHLSSDAQLVGQGGTTVNSSGNAFDVFQNFSAIHFSNDKMSMGYGFRSLDGSDYSLHSVALSYRFSEKHIIGGGAKLFYHPEYNQFDNDGTFLKSFSPRETMFSIGYSYLLNESFAISIASNFINSDLDGSNDGTAFTANASLSYRKQQWSASFGIEQVGSKLKYLDESYSLPARLNLGLSKYYQLADNHSISALIKTRYQFLPSDYTGFIGNLGIVYSFKDKWFVRGGYQFASEEVEPDYASCGIGLKIFGFNLSGSYMFSNEDYFDQNFCFSIQYSLK